MDIYHQLAHKIINDRIEKRLGKNGYIRSKETKIDSEGNVTYCYSHMIDSHMIDFKKINVPLDKLVTNNIEREFIETVLQKEY